MAADSLRVWSWELVVGIGDGNGRPELVCLWTEDQRGNDREGKGRIRFAIVYATNCTLKITNHDLPNFVEAKNEQAENDVEALSKKDIRKSETKIAGTKKTFSRFHAMSIHINLIAVIATVTYGFVLGGSLHM